MTLSVNIIGAGNLGKTIGKLLVKNKLIQVKGICNKSQKSSLESINFIGEGEYYPISELPSADITFITVPDDSIKQVCEELSQNKNLKVNSIILHCSGSLTSETLRSVKIKNCFIASIHPMRSFAKPELSVEQYNGTYCAIEGDKEAISVLSPLFNGIGSITYEIDEANKSLYHAAGVFASNYLVTLAQQAFSCMQKAGVEDVIAMKVITNLMRGTLDNLETTLSPKESLTGPIKRGDLLTIEKHMDALEDSTQKELYCALGKATLLLTSHDENLRENIQEILHTQK